jgi:tetratricopeptide (TPR) repeat protein
MIVTALIVSLVSGALLSQGRGGAPPLSNHIDTDSNALATAKALYESASYEAALELLAEVDKPDALEQIEVYRALCLLALGRTEEAERSLARIVLRKPLYTFDESEMPPRLVALFKEVRKRTLPAAARELYLQAKASYDNERFDAATAELKDLLAVLADAGAADDDGRLADLKMLAEGFLRLSNAEAAARKVSRQTEKAETTSEESTSAPAVYSSLDKDVSPPLELERKTPAWNPPDPVTRKTTFQGLLEVVIDEQGRVESAVLKKPIFAFYNALLLASTRQWRFQPAMRNGIAVKYRKEFEIVLRPPS